MQHVAKPLGASLEAGGTRFAVEAPDADAVSLCLFDGERETRLPMQRGADGVLSLFVAGVGDGRRYGFRADGPWDPPNGHWFDPAKLLADPYAVALDGPWRHDARLAAPREAGVDTAALVPKSVVTALPEPVGSAPTPFRPGGLIYEVNVRALTMQHPALRQAERGLLRSVAHPALIEHYQRIGVDAVELMPIVAWIDERHLPPLGLVNAWGYNPVTMMALDPRLAPGGLADLRHVTDRLREAGIATVLDLVFNHTGESDEGGPTLSLRGLAGARAFRRHDGRLVNDTGTGNTLACDDPLVIRLVLASLRHFVVHGGVDGFRFDLATILGRRRDGFTPDAPLLTAIRADPLLANRILIAEPWDIGPGGYQLGRFGEPFLEWSDRTRDDVRRFWRGDHGMLGAFAHRLSGSSEDFPGLRSRAVSFVAAHDGFSLADIASYAGKHNDANGEHNRDGHDANHSWNNGVEGASDDPAVEAARDADRRALLASLFCTRGAIMLTAGDEFGRTQAGNNNAYCQDGPLTWLDWAGRDERLEVHVAALSALRRRQPLLSSPDWLTERTALWLRPDGEPMMPADWAKPSADTLLHVRCDEDGASRIAILINRARASESFHWAQPGLWRAPDPAGAPVASAPTRIEVAPRSVLILERIG